MSRDGYLSCADTAKLVRKALRADFPGIKFSVRSSTYAGGASIDVSWTDGPIEFDVRDKTLSLYSGASFDGMTDIKSYHDSMLMTDDGPQVVHFGADFVHGQRRVSDVRRAVYRQELRRFLAGFEGSPEYDPSKMLPVSVCGRHGQPELAGRLSHDSHRGEWGSSIVEQMGHLRPWKGERCPGSSDAYCAGCGRWQRGHEREPHTR